MMPFCTTRRFRACSTAMECEPSRTSPVISSPRFAGSRCMTTDQSSRAFLRNVTVDLIWLEQHRTPSLFNTGRRLRPDIRVHHIGIAYRSDRITDHFHPADACGLGLFENAGMRLVSRPDMNTRDGTAVGRHTRARSSPYCCRHPHTRSLSSGVKRCRSMSVYTSPST